MTRDSKTEVRRTQEGGSPSAGERELVALLLRGDRTAFARLVNAHHGSLIRMAIALVGTQAIAEEVVQETWQSMVEHLGHFEQRSSLRTWIFRICSNKAKTRAERESRATPLSALDDGEDGPAVDPACFDAQRTWLVPPTRVSGRSPEQLLQQVQTLQKLRMVLDQLPPAQRAVITLRDVEGFTAQDACNVLGISESNQRVLLHRARSKVRKALENA